MNFLAQCSSLLSSQSPLLLSVLLAGIAGSVSHCSVMCAPMVAAQMLKLQEERAAQWQMIYYHAGRISTYVMLAILANLAGQWLFSGAMHKIANMLLILAGVIFITGAIFPRKTHYACGHKMPFSTLLSAISNVRFQLYIKGFLMGFMPCGMVLSILLIAATLENAWLAAGITLLFGLATMPVLQLVGATALSLGKKHPTLATRLRRGTMALNGLFLCGIGLNLVSVN